MSPGNDFVNFSVRYFPMNAGPCRSLLFTKVAGCSPASLMKETPAQAPQYENKVAHTVQIQKIMGQKNFTSSFTSSRTASQNLVGFSQIEQ